jgi:glutathione S-transferase
MLLGAFSIADAFYAPVAFRFRTYGVSPAGAAGAYMAALLALPAVREWEAAGAADERLADHDLDLLYPDD